MHRRVMMRLPQYDYSTVGAYFVTICVQERRHLFGEIIDGEMKLNRMGKTVQSIWEELPKHYRHMGCDALVIMPNHIHAIVILNDVDGRAGLKPAPTRHGIPEIIRALKTFSARRINGMRGMVGTPIWQRNYYEHVVRNADDLDRIRQYIDENPMKWAFDEENVWAGSKPAQTIGAEV